MQVKARSAHSAWLTLVLLYSLISLCNFGIEFLCTVSPMGSSYLKFTNFWVLWHCEKPSNFALANSQTDSCEFKVALSKFKYL